MVKVDFWETIIDNSYQLPEGTEVMALTKQLLPMISSPDPYLRDHLAHSIFARWMALYNYYSADDLMTLLGWLIPNLETGIGEQQTDSVFLRSYSASAISLIAYRDSRVAWLSADTVRLMLDRAITYLLAERDLRAYVEGKGWINACGHTADWLRFLAYNPALERDDLKRILDAVYEKWVQPHGVVFHHDEDERLAKVVMAVLNREILSIFDLFSWVDRFNEWKLEQIPPSDYDAAYHGAYQNIRHGLRALYIQLQLSPRTLDTAEEFEPYLLDVLKAFSL